MKRKLERKIFTFAGLWNLINGLITVLTYSSWLKIEGISAISNIEPEQLRMTGSLIDSVYMVTVGYGILQIIIGIINFITVRNIRNNSIQIGFIIWIISMCAISIITLDIIGSLLYIVLLVIYQARNKAIKINS